MPAGHDQFPCQVTVPVLTPALTIVKTASTATAVPGQTVTYTITVTDSGQTPYTGATLTDPLAGVLDDAAYNGDAAATAGQRVLRRPEPDLDREPGAGRRRDHHLLGHREQPRHRRTGAHQHRHLDHRRQQLPGRRHRPATAPRQ